VISIAKRARMHELLEQSRRFAVNVLAEEQEKLSRHFGGKPIEGLTPSFEFRDETPLLADALATIAARATDIHPCGDHSLFIGAIFHMSANEHGKPLLFHGGRYGALVHRPGRHQPTPEFW